MLENQKVNENNVHYFFRKSAMYDLLYSTQEKHFQQFVAAGQWSSVYRGHNASYWLDLLYNIFNNYDSVVVEGKPSITMSQE